MPSSRDALLSRLETARSRFGPGAAAETKRLILHLQRCDFDDASSLLRFHEALLFLRAFPQSGSLVPLIERILDRFHLRTERIQRLGADMEVFDDFDTSGVAGTVMQDALGFESARWLVRRIPRNVEIAWNDFWDEPHSERGVGEAWPRFLPLLEEDADVEANIPWRRWLNAARGRRRDLEWLIRRFEELPVSDRVRAELYDALRVPIRWRLENLRLSRTRNRLRSSRLFIHQEPLLTRSQVSLANEFAKPHPRLIRLSPRQGDSIMRLIREVMLVRYRELYGTTLGDPRSVIKADVGRGVVIYLWNLPAARRLPLRAYVAGFTLKNGVPINYIEAIGLCEWIEVGFNTFYTYRQGETAWIYAQALRCLQSLTGATTISVYPYQIGQNNDEALDSGAFWFYRKLGFRSGRPDLEQLARKEEAKIESNPKYRTSRKTLQRLAEAHMFYDAGAMKQNDRARNGMRGPWDTFSTRNLALRVNRRMPKDFEGRASAIREASVQQVSRMLNVNVARWTSTERHCLENWSLVLVLISNLSRWTREEKKDVIAMIRAQAGANEMRYLRFTQRHRRLREELLRLGSRAETSND